MNKLHTLHRLEVKAVYADRAEVRHSAARHRRRFGLAARDAVEHERKYDREEIQHRNHKQDNREEARIAEILSERVDAVPDRTRVRQSRHGGDRNRRDRVGVDGDWVGGNEREHERGWC